MNTSTTFRPFAAGAMCAVIAVLVFAGGAGAQVIQISDFDDLRKIGKVDTHPLSGDYELTADIDASESRDMNSGAGFEPIGTLNRPFMGTFDGKGFKITGLYINRPSTNFVGLFGYAVGGIDVRTIKGVHVFADTIIGRNYVGALAGGTGSISTSDTIFWELDIDSCSSHGVVIGEFHVGGLIGRNYSKTTSSYSSIVLTRSTASSITNSYSTCAVSGISNVGGLVGMNDSESSYGSANSLNSSISSSRIINCYSTGPVNGTRDRVGGLVGHNYSYYSASMYSGSRASTPITNSYSTGSVNGGRDYVGGLVGENRAHSPSPRTGGSASSPITNSYSKGSVNGNNRVGGLVGYNYSANHSTCTAPITDSYATGAVVGVNLVGGLVGSNNDSSANSFWDIETSGIATSNGGTGKTTAEMKQRLTFTDWDFDEVWAINEDTSYPYFLWQDKTTEECTEHSFGDWTITQAAACTVSGSRKRVCNICGHIETETIGALGHDWDDLYTIIVPATCDAPGSEAQMCKRGGCELHNTPREIPQLSGVDCHPTSIASPSPSRVIPASPDKGAAVVSPSGSTSFEIAVGSNPVKRSDGSVKIFASGKPFVGGTLTIYDATGNVVRKINVKDNRDIKDANDNRMIGNWDLRDRNGRLVPDGTYLVKGVIKNANGKVERVSLLIGIR